VVEFVTADGDATTPDDYGASADTLIFFSGQTTKEITLDIVADTLSEVDEQIFVVLQNAGGAVISETAGVGTVTITDDDPEPSVSVADVTVGEGDGHATLTIAGDTVADQEVTVDYTTVDGTATAGEKKK
jgi:hypothetical protein